MKPTAALRGGAVARLAQRCISTAHHQPWIALATIGAGNACLGASLLYLEVVHGVDHWDLVRDTNAIAGQPAYFGAYSNLGVLAWAAAASVPVFTWLLLRSRMPGDERLRVLGLGGLFAAVAGLDDLFMLHENSYVIGVPDKIVMAGYALFLLVFVASAVSALHRTKWLLLLAAIGCFAASTILDEQRFPASVLMEEVSKLTGISFLAAYLLSLSWSAVSDATVQTVPLGSPSKDVHEQPQGAGLHTCRRLPNGS